MIVIREKESAPAEPDLVVAYGYCPFSFHVDVDVDVELMFFLGYACRKPSIVEDPVASQGNRSRGTMR